MSKEAEKLAEVLEIFSATQRSKDNAAAQASALLRRQAEQIRELRQALAEAASSLQYIANTACKRDEELMADAINVRGYARSWASVAELALSNTKEET